MRTLNTPLYEVKQDSELYRNGKRRLDSIEEFFNSFKEKYGSTEGFSFYTSRDFGVHVDTPCYEIFKDSVEEGDKPGYYSFREDSEHYQEIRPMIRKTVDYDGFVLSATFGLFNIASVSYTHLTLPTMAVV